MIPIAGYANRWSVGQNETIQFKVSSEFEQPYSARLVRITCADPNPDGPGIIEHDLGDVFAGEFPSRKQPVKLGSYGFVPVDGALVHSDHYSVCVNIWPTLPQCGKQTIICFRQASELKLLEVYLKNGHLAACINEDTVLRNRSALLERYWYTVRCIVDLKANELHLDQVPHKISFEGIEKGRDSLRISHAPSLPAIDEIYIASSGPELDAAHYNGKIERPGIYKGTFDEGFPNQPAAIANEEILESSFQEQMDTSIFALWDFSLDIQTQNITDIGRFNLHGNLINCPTRAMRGSNWSGNEMAWKHAANEYGAIHFHDDDIYDCNWQTDFEFTVPSGFPSAMYSLRIECNDTYEDIPFYVRPQFGKPQSKICVIVPTFTYTVYTNQARAIAGPEYEALVKERGTRPWTPDEIRDFGLSTYNYHNDGSGICLSSSLRPSLTMRPNYITICRDYGGSGMRHLPADTHLLAWLEHFGYEYDVVCDEDVHREGAELLKPYSVVMTMSHPEYHTRNTLDAIGQYTEFGGRLMYMGGNGFYWKVAIRDDLPGMVEIRRGEGGIRIWAAEPGEYYNALDGEYGGMWLRNGRPPQQIAGVGFTGQGDFQGTYYRRNPDIPKRFEWVFDGIADEILGDFGLSGGGAAGFELDRIDYGLGTPLHAAVLASSEIYPEHFVLVPEEILSHQRTRTGDPVEKLIRADMTIFETSFGGFVFSVGSITYCGSLPWNGFDNNISKLTQNVLNRFLSKDHRRTG
ncbi:MAG: hypothetical protein OXI60_09130 [Acidiferrobacterales bacterium]|nr:hypothetical protein [Acidiferrobacterales bacterium]